MSLRQAAPSHQRARGGAELHFARSGAATRLAHLFQTAPARILFPTPEADEPPLAALVNTAGGLAGGDALTLDLRLGEGAVATLATPSAEKIYRSLGAVTRIDVSIEVGPGATLEWLPQETILFDGARLDRRTRIELGEAAGCLALEAVILGRAAMGETVGRVVFRDRREIWRSGKPVSVEPLGLGDAGLRAGIAGLDGARAFATIVMVGAGLSDALAPLRAVLDEAGVEAAASAFGGKLVVRMRAGEGWPLRRQIVRALQVLRAGRPLPRVWQM